MLRELRIENLLLIERAELRLGEGLNAITGETGAGKTVLAHSLDLLMGGKARAQIVRPGAEEAWVEGVFDLPAGPAARSPSWPSSPSGCPRAPRRSSSAAGSRPAGRTSAFVAGRAATAADLKLLGGAPARLLRPARAPQADDRLGPAGDPRRLRRRRAPGAARALPRGPPRVPSRLARRAGRAARARGLARARPRPLPLRALRDRGGRRPTRTSASATGGRARAAAPRRGPARGGGRRPRRRWPGPTRTAAARPAALAQAESRLAGARPASTPASTRSPSGSPRCAVELGDVGAELRDYAEGVEADPARAGGGRGAARGARPAAAQARRQRRVGARARRALPRGDRAARGRRGARRRGSRRRWPRRSAPRASWARSSAPARAKAAAPLEERGRRRARPSWRWTAPRLEVVLEPHPDGFGAAGARDGRAAGRARTPGSSRRRSRDAASGGELSRVMLALSGLGRAASAGDARLRRDRRRDRRQHGAGRSASGCGRSATSGRSSASPTCRRSPRSPTSISGSRRTSPAAQPSPAVERLDGEERGRRDRPHARRRERRRGRHPPRPRAARRPEGCTGAPPPWRGAGPRDENLVALAGR